MTTPSKEMQQQQYRSSKSTSKGPSLIPIISGQATITKEGSHGGGFVSKFGTTKVLPFEPKVGLTYNIPSWKPFGKKKKR